MTRILFGLTLTLGAFALSEARTSSLDESHGVNLSLDEGFGARSSAMAMRFAPFQNNADAVANSPAGMNDVNDFTFSTAHAERFAEAKLDHFSMLIPFDARNTLGLALSRYGVNNIESHPLGTELDPQPIRVFSTADYWVSAAFARRFGLLDLGGNLNLIYRSLDQSGLGMRGDLMASYTLQKNYRFSTLYRGASPSVTRWSSGYAEYESPDLYLGFTGRFPSEYFYGSLFLSWESEGLFQANAQSTRTLEAYRGAFHPLQAFQQSNFGAEYQFNFGLSLRAGLQELLMNRNLGSILSFGAGYLWRGIIGIDYSLVPHPDLPSSHRIALQFTPAFPKFMGKSYRPLPPENQMGQPHSYPSLPLNQGPYLHPGPDSEPKAPDATAPTPVSPIPSTDKPSTSQPELKKQIDVVVPEPSPEPIPKPVNPTGDAPAKEKEVLEE